MPVFNEWLRLPRPEYFVRAHEYTKDDPAYVSIYDDSQVEIARVFGASRTDIVSAKKRAEVLASFINRYGP